MPKDTGAPDTAVILYAIQRGEYDRDLAMILHAIKERRDASDRLGIIMPSKGDYLEMWGEDDDDVKCPSILRGARLRVVGFTDDKRYRARLEEPRGKYLKGQVFKIDPDWVYRVHYYT